jgi:hypothetical protein
MSKYYNKGNQKILDYKVDNLHILNTKNLSLYHPTKKFTMKMVRPFKIDKSVLPIAVYLNLTEVWKINPVFYVKSLKPFRVQPYTLPNLQKVLQELHDLMTPEFKLE